MDPLAALASPGLSSSSPRPLGLQGQASSSSAPSSSEHDQSRVSPKEKPKDSSHETAAEVITRIESILESILDALIKSQPLSIPLRSRRSGNQVPVTFPVSTSAGSKKFAALLRILCLCHEALVSKTIITKRNIYYQNPVLFGNQAYVDQLVDDFAFTLGVSRDSLNVVAASKGLIAAGKFHPGHGNHGVPVPQATALDELDLGDIRWILVVEKEATFRSLAARRSFETSAAGPGILVTAKGYPDLVTRQFLHTVHSKYPYITMHALVDFDPDGIAIMRTYKYGSRNLGHEQNISIRGLIWLGVKSRDILGLPAQLLPRQRAQLTKLDEASPRRSELAPAGQQPPLLASSAVGAGSAEYKAAPLTQHDRRTAIGILSSLGDQHTQEPEDAMVAQELHLMLMLNMKFEVQAIGNGGSMASWLDERLRYIEE